jgi:hypothetical protein
MTGSDASRIYEFVYRGHMAEQALDAAGRKSRRLKEFAQEETARALSLDLLASDDVANAQAMANVYVAVAAFENSARALITDVLLEQVGADWWQTAVSEKIRTRAEAKRAEEEKVKWHVQRGADPINYTQMPDLASIIRQNWVHFQPHIPELEWADSIFDVIERSRNVIMHSGMLSVSDVQRLGVFIRDWIAQVGA